MLLQKHHVEVQPQSRPEDNIQQNLDQVAHLIKQVRAQGQGTAASFESADEKIQLPAAGKWLFLGDVAALLLAFVVSGLITWLLNTYVFHKGFQAAFSAATLEQFAIYAELGIVALLWLDTKGHYRQRLPFWEIVGNVQAVALVGFVVAGFIQFALKGQYSRLWFGLSWFLFAIFIYVGRSFVRRWLDYRGQWQIPAVVIGNGPTAKAAVRALVSEPQMGYKILEVISADRLEGLTKPVDWRAFLQAVGASYLFLALEGGELEHNRNSLKAMVRERLPYSILPPWLGLPLCGLSSHHFMMHDVMLMHDTNRLQMPLPRLMKRTFDVVLAGAAIFLLSPLFAAIAVLVRRDGGNVLFCQSRVGLKGKKFKCYKFRSMRDDAEAALNQYLENNSHAAEEWKKYQKLKKDPRITKIGQFIRRTSIDELPQLFNVIKGDMSLVGPRPFLPGQEIYYGDDYDLYKSARPGITGPWQVSGRNELTFKQRVALEAWYIRNWSFWMDFIILMKTLPAIVRKDSAF